MRRPTYDERLQDAAAMMAGEEVDLYKDPYLPKGEENE